MTAALLVATPASPAAASNSDLPLPVFAGAADPVPTTPGYTANAMMQTIFAADQAAGAGSDSDHDFWVDAMLARTGTAGDSNPGNSDNNQWMFSRGRTLFMKSHDPAALGFGGDVAYIESIDGRPAYTVTVSVDGSPVTLRETTAQRKQTPSYWRAVFTGGGLTVTETKYITDGNVAVTGLQLTNTGADTTSVTLTATSPYATAADGEELIGTTRSFNKLTVLRPRFSGDGFTPADGALTSTVSVPAAASVTTKLQEGFVTDEIDNSRTDYEAVKAATPAAAFTAHVTAYNRWWAENVPFIDIPDKNIEKTLYYRWWLMRFNFLDANIPGNDYQFPTAVEGALGYNNAIVLTSGMFIDDLKYLRDPSYAYGTWVSAGEVAKSSKYIDNPGDPANWSNSYTEYITEAAWRSYQLHGGPSAVAANLARYGENDVKGLLAAYDSNHNNLIEYNWGAMTGNDADAVSFHWRPGANMDRTESAYLYSNAMASAAAYRAAGNTAKAQELETLAGNVKQAVLDVLWNPDSKLLEHRIVGGDQAYVPWKEINNYYPFTVGLMPKPDGTAENDQYTEALRLWADDQEYPIFPFYTANQKDKAAAAAAGEPGSNNFSVINSTVTFRLLSSVLRNYPTQAITADDYKKLLYWNAWAQYQSGDNRYPDQNEFWADGSADPQRIGYRSWIHHTILGATNFTVIEDVAGLRQRDDAKIELSPIDIGWDHFTVNNIRYRDRDLTITWDKPGDGDRPYGTAVPEGYSIYLDGERVMTVDSLAHLVYDPAAGTVSFPDGGTAQVVAAGVAQLDAPAQVTFGEHDRVVDVLAKAGQDIATVDGSPVNLAAGAVATASFTASGRPATAAVDGSTVNEPFWGTAGSPSASDTIDIDLGAPKEFDDIRVHFYRSSTTATAAGYAEPASYQVSYLDGDTWRVIPGQLRTPTAPQANLNEARFAPTTAQKIRLTVTHQPGTRTGVKEVLVYRTGQTVVAPGNQAPLADAWVDNSVTAPGQASLVGTAKDDGLPSGTVTAKWTVVHAPDGGSAVFTDAAAASTVVKFTAAGTYQLRLTVSDGTLSSTADVTVEGTAAGAAGTNVALTGTPTAEYTASWNNVNAVNDGTGANTGGEQSALWGTWSGSRPATRWLQYTWSAPVRVSSTGVTFWWDSPRGTGDGVAVPASWTLQYLAADGTTWVDVPNPSGFPTKDTGVSSVTFDAVTTTALRATFTADSTGSSNSAIGVSEWQVFAPTGSVGPVDIPTTVGVIPTLPATVDQVYSDGSRVPTAVTWPEITADQVSTAGTHVEVTGVLDGGGTVTATIWVRVTSAVQINVIEPVSVTTPVGRAPQLPGTVTALYNDGSKDSRIVVTWDPIEESAYAQPGTFDVGGAVEGTDKRATATVTVGDGTEPPDTSAPELSLTAVPAEPDGENDWYIHPVQFTVAATDDRDPAPTVEVDVDEGGWTPVTGPLTVAADGVHVVRARALDAADNQSTAQRSVSIDTTEPVSNASLDGRTVTLRGADATSRLDRIVYRIGTGAWQDYSAPFQVGPAAATITYAAIDRAGLRETDNVLQVPAAGVISYPSKIVATVSPARAALGTPLTARVSVTSAAPTAATGVVVVLAGSVEVGRGRLSGGAVTLRLATAAALPTSALTVRYAGDATHRSAAASVAVKLVKATGKVSVTLVKPTITVGSSTTARIKVAATGLTPSGRVVLKRGTRVVGTATLSRGTATIRVTGLPVGRYQLTATYSGDARVTSASAGAAVTVVKASSTTTATVTPSTVRTTARAHVVVKVRSSVRAVTPSGRVVIDVGRSGRTVLSRIATISGGGTTVLLPRLAPGSYRVVVRYQGSATVAGSTDAARPLVVTR